MTTEQKKELRKLKRKFRHMLNHTINLWDCACGHEDLMDKAFNYQFKFQDFIEEHLARSVQLTTQHEQAQSSSPKAD